MKELCKTFCTTELQGPTRQIAPNLEVEEYEEPEEPEESEEPDEPEKN